MNKLYIWMWAPVIGVFICTTPFIVYVLWSIRNEVKEIREKHEKN